MRRARYLIPNIWILPTTMVLPSPHATSARVTKRAAWKTPWAMSKRIFSPGSTFPTCRHCPCRATLAGDCRQCSCPRRNPQKSRGAFRKRARLPIRACRKPLRWAPVSQVRASSQFRVILDTNRYSVPAPRVLSRSASDVRRLPGPACCIYCGDQLLPAM